MQQSFYYQKRATENPVKSRETNKFKKNEKIYNLH